MHTIFDVKIFYASSFWIALYFRSHFLNRKLSYRITALVHYYLGQNNSLSAKMTFHIFNLHFFSILCVVFSLRNVRVYFVEFQSKIFHIFLINLFLFIELFYSVLDPHNVHLHIPMEFHCVYKVLKPNLNPVVYSFILYLK